MQIEEWEQALKSFELRLAPPPLLPAWAKSTLKEARQIKTELGKTLQELKTARHVTTYTIGRTENKIRRLSILTDNVTAVADALAKGEGFAVFLPQAISDSRILPDSFPVPANIGDTLRIKLCRGEYESASLALFALEKIAGLEVSVTNLKGPGVIPQSEIEASVVKCWWQAGFAIFDSLHTTLAPELLLKDDDLVRTDLLKKINYVRSTRPDGTIEYLSAGGRQSENLNDLLPKDADHLLPFSIPQRQVKQVWFTFHAPENAEPGVYSGQVRLKSPQGEKAVKIEFNVLPFALEPSPLVYSIYYRGLLADKGSISSEGKSEQQYLTEMKDLKAHGVLYPTLYQAYSPDLLPRALELRALAGLPADTLYALGISTGNPQTQNELHALYQETKQWMALAGEYGYDELYIYGLDEAVGDRLKSQRAAWTTVHNAGAKVFTACFKGAFKYAGDLLDTAVVFGAPDPAEAAKYHGRGHKIFCYAYPQVGEENPETYRRNFGLLLLKAGYDGAMDYAYQHGFNNIWNDFDSFPWRDHNFTYPTVDGIVGTRQWEGFREAVDDVRYVATLKKAIREVSGDKTALAQEAKDWLEKINPTGDLYRLRAKLIDWILLLTEKPVHSTGR